MENLVEIWQASIVPRPPSCHSFTLSFTFNRTQKQKRKKHSSTSVHYCERVTWGRPSWDLQLGQLTGSCPYTLSLPLPLSLLSSSSIVWVQLWQSWSYRHSCPLPSWCCWEGWPLCWCYHSNSAGLTVQWSLCAVGHCDDRRTDTERTSAPSEWHCKVSSN